MREMLLAAAVCGAFGLAVADLRTASGDAAPAARPSADAEVTAILAMMGAPSMVVDEDGGRADRSLRRSRP